MYLLVRSKVTCANMYTLEKYKFGITKVYIRRLTVG